MKVKEILNLPAFAILRHPGQGTKANFLVPSSDLVSNLQTFVFCPFNAHAKHVRIVGTLNKIHLADGDVIHPRPETFPTPELRYLSMIEQGIDTIRKGHADKLVLSRKMELRSEKALETILADLASNYPNALVYAVSHPECGTWFGATPEVLLRKSGSTYETMALAGTKTKEQPREWTSKEIEEQQYVQDFIEDVIAKNNGEIVQRSETYDSQAGALLHLRTDYKFECQKSIDHILSDLHPTPATCGLPKHQAMELIANLEYYDRQYYCGYLGTMDQNGAELFVNLRCASMDGNIVTLYAGGGITKDSNPEQEWMETCSKLNTLLAVL